MDSISLMGLIATLVVDTSFSWVRMFIALGISVVVSIGVGIYAATHRTAEKIILPVVDVLQTLPILAFFPFVILVVVATIPGYAGINAAVIFLIITSMIWNIIFGVYESIKVLPKEYTELSRLYQLSRLDRLRKLYIPATLPRVVEQSILSWSIGLFYLVTSEIFSTGSSSYRVQHGIGAAIASLAASGNTLAYLIGLAIFIIFVVATRFLFFRPLEDYVTRYNKHVQQKTLEVKRMSYVREMSELGTRIMKRLGSQQLVKIGSRLAGGGGAGRQKGWADEEYKGTGLWKFARYLVPAAVVLLAVYLVATNTYLIGYELTVLHALVFSFARVWIAFAVSLAIGIPVCVYLIFITRHSSKYLLLFQILASIPATILLPAIANGLKGYPNYGEIVAFVVFVLSSIWYIVFSTMNMAKTLNPEIFEVKKIFGVRGAGAWKKIYLKAIIPGIITGAITAIAAEWNASIVAEYFAFGSNVSQVGTGIGKLLDLALAGNNLTLMLIALVNLTVMILIINTFVWKRLYRNVSSTYG
ncbi:MAG TPA: ABC transporter permease subunit [Candidatus Saccharimonadales bacterium]|nr:ABC transporter permease subunit [Candidatus Saccharimonadales bacterium]